MAKRPDAAASRAWAVVLAAVLAAPGFAAAANPARRQCIKACKADRAPCLGLASARKSTLSTQCTGAGAAKRQCLGLAKHVFKTARRSCAKLLGDCRACCKANGQGPTCPVGHPVAYTPPPPTDLGALGLPTAPSGRPLLLGIPGAQLEIDPTRRDALTALGACARWITACVVSTHSIDDCARSAPLCATSTPWQEHDECCAPSCFERYQESRRAGADPLTAFEGVLYGADPCMPGVGDLLRDGRQ